MGLKTYLLYQLVMTSNNQVSNSNKSKNNMKNRRADNNGLLCCSCKCKAVLLKSLYIKKQT